MSENCGVNTGDFINGCDENIGTIKHVLIANKNPGKVAVADLCDLDFVNTKLIADGDDRWGVLTGAFKEEIKNQELTTDAGTFYDKVIGKKSGAKTFKFESSLCKRILGNEITQGSTVYVAYITDLDILKAVLNKDDSAFVQFLPVRITSLIEEQTATTTELVGFTFTEIITNYVSRNVPFASVVNLSLLAKVELSIAPIADSSTTAVVTAVGCDLTTPVTDLDVAQFELTVNGTTVVTTPTVGGNVYTFATIPAMSTGDVVTVKVIEPSASSQLYISNTATTIVTA